MREIKTRATDASVEGYLAAIEDELRVADCRELVRLMSKVTRKPATMWGTSIVGFGTYHYTYTSGRSGDSCATGFSSRKGDISIYLTASFPGQEDLLAKLGRHKMGKACLSIRRLSDVDMKILERLIAGSVAEIRRRYG
jgi:Domain of unknown function (DU1801)